MDGLALVLLKKEKLIARHVHSEEKLKEHREQLENL
jgi:hypothetical protein